MRRHRLLAVTGSVLVGLLPPLVWAGSAGASPPPKHIRGPNGACQYYDATATTQVNVGFVFTWPPKNPPRVSLTTLRPNSFYQLGVAAASGDISAGCAVRWQSVRTNATGDATATLNLSWLAHGTGTALTYTLQVVVSQGRSLRNGYVTPPFTLTITPPSAPATVTARAGDRSARVTFGVPGGDGALPVIYYKVTATDTTHRFRGGQTAYVRTTGRNSTTGRSAVVRGLAPGDAYTFTVTAVNAQGPGTVSTPSTPVVPRGR